MRFTPPPRWMGISGCHALFYFWAAGSLMVYMLADRTVTRMSCTPSAQRSRWSLGGSPMCSRSCRLRNRVAHHTAVNPEQPRTWMELLFLSFTNLSSTGLSDVIPITGQARSVVMFEQLAGLGYVALFVSRLVGLTIVRQ